MSYPPSDPHRRSRLEWRFLWCLLLNGGLALGELVASILTGSSALLADGLMNADDTAALLLSLYSERKTRQGPDMLRTFGYKRMDAFAGFVKGCLLLTTSFLALLQALRLLLMPEPIAGGVVFIVGAIALGVNLLSALFLKEDVCHSLNAKGTYACMAYDAVGSAAVLVSGFLSMQFGLVYFDAAAALLIAFFMAKTGWGIFSAGTHLFLQSAPENFDFESFERAVREVHGVTAVGDIHVWQLTPLETHLTCKVNIQDMDMCECERILEAVEHICSLQFSIHHCTIQPVYSKETLERFCKLSHPADL